MDQSEGESETETLRKPSERAAPVDGTCAVLLPQKSEARYNAVYVKFMEWRSNNKVQSFGEDVLLAYFNEIEKQLKPSSLWATYSMLRSVLVIKDNVNIANFGKLITFLKAKSSGFKSKKSKTLTADNVRDFIQGAPDKTFLLTKTVLIIGISGACRKQELKHLKIRDIQDVGNKQLLVNITKGDAKIERSFVIRGDFYGVCKKYLNIRLQIQAPDITQFFINYQKGRCTRQVVGIHKIANVPKLIATYLKLENPSDYTTHCLRRTSASLLVNGGDLTALKSHGRSLNNQSESDSETEIPTPSGTTVQARQSLNNNSMQCEGDFKTVTPSEHAEKYYDESSNNQGEHDFKTGCHVLKNCDESSSNHVMQSESDSETEIVNKHPDVAEETDNCAALLPQKSKSRYEAVYAKFMDWRLNNEVESFSENVLLAYFNEIEKQLKPSSLWANYSMLKSVLSIKHKINIANYVTLLSFLKGKSSGFKSKKSMTLTADHIRQFIQEAPDKTFLLTKTVLIVGISGACRKQELKDLKIKDIQDLGDKFLVNISKTGIERSFVICGDFYVVCKKYLNIRLQIKDEDITQLFINYQNGRCTRQVVGIHKIGYIPKQIAEYLKLENPADYTGHCFRRTSATLHAGDDLMNLKYREKWGSSNDLTVRSESDSETDVELSMKCHEELQASSNLTPQRVMKMESPPSEHRDESNNETLQSECILKTEIPSPSPTITDNEHFDGWESSNNHKDDLKTEYFSSSPETDIKCEIEIKTEVLSMQNYEDADKYNVWGQPSNNNNLQQNEIDIKTEILSSDDDDKYCGEQTENVEKCDVQSESDSEVEILTKSPEVIERAENICAFLLPQKSKARYEAVYAKFMDWRLNNNVQSFAESALLEYFNEIEKQFKPSSLWATYSMLRSVIIIKHNINIAKYTKLITFLKRKSSGYKSKKSKALTVDHIRKFIQEAPDKTFLLTKTVLIVGISGACRKHELKELKIKDVVDLGNKFLVNISRTETEIERSFVICGDFYSVCKKYLNIRLQIEDADITQFFINYQNGRCTRQVAGINKIGSIPKDIARYLKLEDPSDFTGHCFRRTSEALKNHDGWWSLINYALRSESEIMEQAEVFHRSCNTFREIQSTSPEITDQSEKYHNESSNNHAMQSESDSETEIISKSAEQSENICSAHLPPKSKERYKAVYAKFMDWRLNNKVESFSENALLAYFNKIEKQFKPSSLWATYSMLRSMLTIKHNTNIANYAKLLSFLKRKSNGFESKKSKTLTADHIKKFLAEAPDKTCLLTKTVLIIGISGGCRKHELKDLKTEDIVDLGDKLLVNISKTQREIERSFVVSGDFYGVCKRYLNIRLQIKDADITQFFINYRNGKCTRQVVGINKVGMIPKQIASFLKLDNPADYTGNCFRRSSATLLVNPMDNLTNMKRHGSWPPSITDNRLFDKTAMTHSFDIPTQEINSQSPSLDRHLTVSKLQNISLPSVNRAASPSSCPPPGLSEANVITSESPGGTIIIKNC